MFITFVKKCYPHHDMTHLTVVSDQDKGIKRAVQEIIPSVGHFYCSKHRAENVKLRCNAACKEAFLHTVGAPTTEELVTRKAAYENNSKITTRNLAYINGVPDNKQYPIAHITSTGSKLYGRSTSSFVEAMNEANRPVRKVVTMDLFNSVLSLHRLEMERFQKNQSHAHRVVHQLTPRAFDRFEKLRTKTLGMQVSVLQGNIMGEVRSSSKAFAVQLKDSPEPGSRFSSCSCGYPKLEEFPCVHMVCFGLHVMASTESLVPLWCHSTTWRSQYPLQVCSAIPSAQTIKSGLPDNNLQLPACAPSRRGRPRQNRYRSAGERQTLRHCTICFAQLMTLDSVQVMLLVATRGDRDTEILSSRLND
ncbi:MAG: hypothetical protein ACREOZ_04840 [Gloeomargaritales cyanobacterium]